MNVATILRYMKTKANGYWDHRYFIQHDYKLFADKYGVGMLAVMSEEAIPAAVAACDGLFVPGSGTNIDPTYYGGAPFDPPNVVDEYALDSKIMRAFYEAGKPIFGICGGQQAINVFFGGTLAKVPDLDAHYDKETATHMINVAPDSFVMDVFGKPRVLVNSHHSWRIDRLAPNFTVAATTDDGVIEAIEWKEAGVFATLWHPEQTFHRGAPLDPVEHKFIENFLARCEAAR